MLQRVFIYIDDDDAHGLCFNEFLFTLMMMMHMTYASMSFFYIDDGDAHRLCFNEFLFTLMMMMHMVYASMSLYLH